MADMELVDYSGRSATVCIYIYIYMYIYIYLCIQHSTSKHISSLFGEALDRKQRLSRLNKLQ